MDADVSYSKDELVWAKIRGYPWWPGIVAKIISSKDSEPTKYLINFIGDNSQYQYKIAKYAELYHEVASKTRTKSHKQAVQIADQIQKGSTTYENEARKLQQKTLIKNSDQKKKSKRKLSSSSEEASQSKKEETKNLSAEIADLIKALNEQKVNNITIEKRVQSINAIIDKNTDDVLGLLKSQQGRELTAIQESLVKKQANGTRNLVQVIRQVENLIDRLKEATLKLYFDPKEILEQLHHVSGQKKITQKLLEKLSTQVDWIFQSSSDDEEESSLEVSIDSSSNQKRKQTGLRRKLSESSVKKKIVKKQSTKESQNQNPKLRKKVCHKIKSIIQENFDEVQAKTLSVIIENRLREHDPTMGNRYKANYFIIVDNLKRVTKQQLIKAQQNIEKLWTLLTQQQMESNKNIE